MWVLGLGSRYFNGISYILDYFCKMGMTFLDQFLMFPAVDVPACANCWLGVPSPFFGQKKTNLAPLGPRVFEH